MRAIGTMVDSGPGRNDFRSRLCTLVQELAERLRARGIKASVHEEILAVQLITSYGILKGRLPELCSDEVRWLLESVFVKRPVERPVFEAVWRELARSETGSTSIIGRMMANVEEDLRRLNLRFGESIRSVQRLLDARSRKEYRKKVDAYVRLRKLGVITREGNRERVLRRDEALSVLRKLADEVRAAGTEEYHDVAWRSAPGGKWEADFLRLLAHSSSPVSEETRRLLTVSQLEKLLNAASREGERRLMAALGAELASRVKAHGVKGISDLDTTLRNMMEAGAIDNEVLTAFLAKKPKLAGELVDRCGLEGVLKALSLLPWDKAREAIRHAARKASLNELREALKRLALNGKLPVESLADALPKTALGEDRVLSLVSSFGSLVRNLRRYLLTGEQGFMDLAQSEYGRVKELMSEVLSSTLHPSEWKVLKLAEHLRELSSALTGDTYLALARFYSKFYTLPEALDRIAELYRTSSDPAVKRRLLALAQRLWRLNVRKLRGDLRVRKLHTERRTERLDLRRTLRMWAYMNYERMVYTARSHAKALTLVVDYSASMREYSAWALAIASIALPRVRRLVLFSDRATVIDVRSRSLALNKLVEALLAREFKGYTNIAGAIRAATSGLAPHTLIVITDLAQTVLWEEDVAKVVADVSKRGWRPVFVTPARHDIRTATLLRSMGIKVYTLKRPRDVLRVLARMH